jgi:hypothetical protein
MVNLFIVYMIGMWIKFAETLISVHLIKAGKHTTNS